MGWTTATGLPAGKKIREEGTDGRIRSGPFIWQRCSQQSTVRLSRRRRILLFCLQGSVTLNFHSFSYTLTPGSVATVDGRLLCECWCTGVTELMEYLPRDRRFHVYESGDNRSAFTVLSVQGRLSDWAAAIALRIRAGAPLSCYSFCSVAVQLRDCARGQIPYPFSCAPGCPVWKRCAGTAACMEMRSMPGKQRNMVTETVTERIISILATIVGIGLWGGLLLYGTIIKILDGLG